MADRDATKRMFTHMINMMEQHDTMTISCGDPLMKLLKDVRELLKEQDAVVRCKDCKHCKVIDWGDSNPYYGSCQYFNTHTVDADGFCYKAERKDSD